MPVSDQSQSGEPTTYTLRGVRVVLDEDAARLYGVSTRYLKAQATRNRDRFPPGFSFRLTPQEAEQFGPSADSRRTARWVFTAEGVTMLSSVLNSPTAARIHVQIIRTTLAARV